MIAIIDYGMGNSGSIQNMLARIGAASTVTSDRYVIESATKLILPGVGAFDSAVMNLRRLDLVSVLNAAVLEERKPILGICLGVQLFTEWSEEGMLPGLGWIEAETIRFDLGKNESKLRVPHMGWNSIKVERNGYILDGLPENPRFYFVHSYHVRCRNRSDVLASSFYGVWFDSAVVRENIVGTQFHPEKSHRFGIKVLKNFAGVAE